MMKLLTTVVGALLVLSIGLYADFNKTLILEGITFHISAVRSDMGESKVVVKPDGLAIDNRKMEVSVEGSVVGAEMADINHDGSPELYIFIVSDGSGSYGSLVAFSTNRKKSLSDIYLPPLLEDKINNKGYMGHDSFHIKEGRLVRRFPVYQEGDPNCCPSGGERRLEYRLVAGEAGWKLELIKSETVKK